MVGSGAILNALLILGVIGALLAVGYFVFRGLQQDHSTGEYHFTWGVSIVVLFLLGLLPGIVGGGLYLTVEKGYPLYWLILCLVIVSGLVILAGASLSTDIEAGVIGAIAAGWG